MSDPGKEILFGIACGLVLGAAVTLIILVCAGVLLP